LKKISLSTLAAEKPSHHRTMSVVDKRCNEFNAGSSRPQDEMVKLGTICREAVKRELKGKHLLRTANHWTLASNKTCSCLTAHWIEQGGKMKRCALTFEVFHFATDAGLELGKDFVKRFDARGFDIFVVAEVTDAAGNMKTLGKHLQEKGVAHTHCVDHNLHRCALLSFKDANLPGIENAMAEAARSLVGFFTKSSQAMAKLLAQQKQLNELKQAVKLFQEQGGDPAISVGC
jgi:hypothetical protein